jgi:hypothetical protein
MSLASKGLFSQDLQNPVHKYGVYAAFVLIAKESSGRVVGDVCEEADSAARGRGRGSLSTLWWIFLKASRQI